VPREPLPIDPYLDEIRARVREARAAVVTAMPGAGKTTRVPPALVEPGPGTVMVLQPRRIAARAIARRIAAEQGWTIGEEIGWHVRFDRRAGRETRVLLATEGILTAYLQQDPLLSTVATLVIDEFHERSIHADLGLTLARHAWRARDDLRLVIMSATLDAGRVSAFLGGCPTVDVPGRVHPVSTAYLPDASLTDAVQDAAAATSGQILCFLPGAAEIRRAIAELRPTLDPSIDIVPLHGSLDAADQDAAIRPSPRRRVILATNIAETSLTVPGVTGVVDSGLHKLARYDPARAIDSLDTERVTGDAADQRAGRAGRLGPGVVRRLWDPRIRLAPHREPEIARIDLSGAVLDVIVWGGDPRTLDWFEMPAADRLDAAVALLVRLGALDSGPSARITPLGAKMQRLGVHPRLARILIEGQGARECAAACAILSERHFLPPRRATTACDLLSALDEWALLPSHVRSAADHLERLARGALGDAAVSHAGEAALRRALLAGYPDRVARRRSPGSPRLLLASGHGATLSEDSGVRDGEFLVAIDVQAARRGAGAEAIVRNASRVEREWLVPTARTIDVRVDPASGVVRAFAADRYEALTLAERAVDPDPDTAAAALFEAFLDRDPSAADARLVRRLRFAGLAGDTRALAERAARRARRLADIDLAAAVSAPDRRTLDRLAPETIRVPSGRDVRLEYGDEGRVWAAVKLQELFGLADTPRVGPRADPVTLHLLAPNGRPVQVTRDLRSFWDRAYQDVRKELRARYPKHPWPEDPWTAPATARTVRRRP
jgi:ATP-dependent RNA helicase HrpB